MTCLPRSGPVGCGKPPLGEALGFGSLDPALAFDGRRILSQGCTARQQTIFLRRAMAKGDVTLTPVIVPPPSLNCAPGRDHDFEPVQVQAFIPERAVERLDDRLVGRLARP
jgi:hypothetical protein